MTENKNASEQDREKRDYLVTDSNYESYIRDGWFTEQWHQPYYGMKIKVNEILHYEESPYQKILVFKSEFGNVLVLDGITQCTERDEFVYQEMISHIPLNSHPNPENVLIIGGGDGGVLREVVKHPRVKSVTLCEIDERVIEVSKMYLPNMSVDLDHPKAKIVIEDGSSFIRNRSNEFDVIITDSSDPIGPNEVLFENNHFRLIEKCLKDDGIMCSQGECIWLDAAQIQQMMRVCRQLFSVVRYSSFMIPTYPGGQIGLLVASKSKETVFEKPLRCLSKDDLIKYNLKYYSSRIHETSFVLPRFAQDLINQEIS